jgi:leader peptidase (prepilin peptidase)/N-methyltransferase
MSELLTGVIFVLTYYLSSIQYIHPYVHIVHVLIAALLIVILFSDFRYQIIPDEIQVGLVVLSFVRFFLVEPNAGSEQLGMRILAGIVVMLPLLVIYMLTRGKGMGFGDVKFSFCIGLLLGIMRGGLALYISFIIGGIIGICLLSTKKSKLKTKIAFGPFLIIGLYIMLFFGDQVVSIVQRVYPF